MFAIEVLTQENQFSRLKSSPLPYLMHFMEACVELAGPISASPLATLSDLTTCNLNLRPPVSETKYIAVWPTAVFSSVLFRVLLAYVCR